MWKPVGPIEWFSATFVVLVTVVVALLLWAAIGRPLLDQALLEPFEERALARLEVQRSAVRGVDVSDILSRELVGLGDDDVYRFLVSHGFSKPERWRSLPVGETMQATSVIHSSIVGDKRIQLILRKQAGGASVVSARAFVIML